MLSWSVSESPVMLYASSSASCCAALRLWIASERASEAASVSCGFPGMSPCGSAGMSICGRAMRNASADQGQAATDRTVYGLTLLLRLVLMTVPGSGPCFTT